MDAMNFPATQKTGRRAEVAVEDHFLSWDWNVGHDHIDIGYDLCITPDHAVYQGIRFLVQVKGTSIGGRAGLTARVTKKRLRQYARDVLPVFIIRSTSHGDLYWIHAQAWARINEDALVGLGTSQVAFDPLRTLSDRATFEDYLNHVVRPLLAPDALAVINDERVFNLNAPNPQFTGSPKPKPTNRSVEKSANHAASSSPLPEAQLSFRPLRTEENMQKLREAFEFGLPSPFEVEDFRITPPPELPELKGVELTHGTLTMRPIDAKRGSVQISPGRKYFVLSQELTLAADLFSGTKGIGITNQSYPSALDLKMRIAQEGKRLRADINLGIRMPAISERPLQEFQELSSLATWAEQIAAENSLHIALEFDGLREQLSPAVEPITSLLHVLQRVRAMSRLHMVTRALNSNFVLTSDMHFSLDDFQDIDLAFELLRGERKSVNLGPLEVELADASSREMTRVAGEFVCTTTWEFAIGGKHAGYIPIMIELPGYVLEEEEVPGATKVRIARGEHGKAWMTYSEHHDFSSSFVRKPRET
jgi:hypothetical protein